MVQMRETSIKSIRKIQLARSEKYYCISVPDPHEILIIPANSTTRYVQHNCNFGLIFGMGAPTFSRNSLETKWSVEKIEKFIEDKNLWAAKQDWAQRGLELELCGYYAVAQYLRTEFFKTYPGLEERIKRTTQEGIDQGYIRSIFGAIRRVPMLHHDFQGRDSDRKELAGSINICANTAIQNMEAVKVIAKGIVAFESWTREHKMESYIIGTVHDSVDFIIKKSELLPVMKAIAEYFETDEDWQHGISLPIELMMVDLSDPHQYYKHGTKVKNIKRYIHQLEYAQGKAS